MAEQGWLAQKLEAQKNKIVLATITIGFVLAAIIFWLGHGPTPQGTAPQLTVSFVIIGFVVLLVTFGIVVVALLSKTPGKPSDSSAASGSSLDGWQKRTLLVLVVLGALGVGGTFAWVGWGLKLNDAGPELTLPLIVIIGVVVLLLTLALVAVTFSILDMQDRAQPLALPEGSVRAVIALMLLLVFAIAAIFLYSNVAASGRLRIAENQTAAALAEMKKHVTVVFTLPPEPAPGAPAPAAGTPAPTYMVYYREPGSPAGDDIAKQLIVLLGTLVTAVASFYFGSSSVSSARDAAERALRGVAGPNATGANPNAVTANGTSQSLAVTGANLQNVNSAKLVNGATTVSANSVKASPTNVACSFTVPPGTPPGAYNLEVSDNQNNSSTLPNGVTINAATQQPNPAAASKPTPTGLDPTTMTMSRGSNAQTLRVNGTNLDRITKVELKSPDGQTVIQNDANSVKPTPSQVASTMSIPAAAPQGAYEVFVTEGATPPVTVPTNKVTIT
jgi:hypothetical protein